MWPDSCVLIIINVLVLSVLSLPLNTDWSTLQYDPGSVARNEKILKLSLQLAIHTADRLMHLRNETDHNCNRHNLPSTTEAIITQLSSQADLEQFDKEQEIQNHSSFGDSQVNNNNQVSSGNLDHSQTAFLYSTQSQELFNPRDLQESVSNRNFVPNLDLKANNLIPKSVQEVPNVSPDFVRHNHEVSSPVTLQKSIFDSNTASNSLIMNEFNPDARNSQHATIDGISERLFNPINSIKNISNATVINDLTETVNKFLQGSRDLQESALGMSQRLYGTDLVKDVPGMKIMSDLHENVNRHIPWPLNAQEPSNKIDVSQRFLDPTMIKNFGNVLSSQVASNLPAMSQMLSNTKNIIESVIKALPERKNVRSASNLFNQIIPQSQNITNAPFKIIEKDQGYSPDFSSAQHQQIKETAKQAEDKTDNPIRDRQNLVSNSGNVDAANISKEDTQKTKDGSFPVNTDNSKAQNSDQPISTSPIDQKNPSVPLLRSLSDFNEHKKTENDFSSIQTNESANNSTDEKLSIRNHQGMKQHLNQINEEIKSEGSKESEIRTDYKSKQLNSTLEDLSQREGKGLKDAAVETLMSSDRLEFDASTISSAMEHQDESSNGLQDSGNVNTAAKSDLGKTKKFHNNLSAKESINRSIGKQDTRVDNLSKLDSYSHFIDNLKDKNLHEQLSTELQEMSERLIDALRPIIEKEMANSKSHMTNHHSGSDKNLPSLNSAF